MALKEIIYQNTRFGLSYNFLNLSIPNPKGVLVFLHGWGSNKELMKLSFEKAFAEFIHLYVDLPGFGASACEVVLFTKDYAQILKLFFNELKVQNEALDSLEWIMLGHSFGGKVATLLAEEKLILLSSAGIVRKKSLLVRTKILFAKIAKKLGISAKALRAKDSVGLNEAMYQTFKNVVDEDFSAEFRACKAETFIFWGKEDSATPLDSGMKIAELMQNCFFLPLPGDHYFFMNQAQKIEEQYMQEQTQKNTQNKELIKHFLIFGKVQGVGYRKYAKYKADQIGVFGSAQNLNDGSVEVWAQGSEKLLKKYLIFLKRGSERAVVERVQEVKRIEVKKIETQSQPQKRFEKFTIIK